MTGIVYGIQSHAWVLHERNQDAAYADIADQWKPGTTSETECGLFIVADGMGGMAAGDQASRLAIHSLVQVVFGGLHPNAKIADLLHTGIQRANTEIQADLPGAGSTLSAVFLSGRLATIAHVGDTRVYRIDEDGVQQLTHDHSLVQRLVDVGQLTPEEAQNHPQKNVITRAVGTTDTCEPDIQTHLLLGDVHLLLCSDGLWGTLDDDTLRGTIQQTETPQHAADELVRLAVEAGAQDDVTALVVAVPRS